MDENFHDFNPLNAQNCLMINNNSLKKNIDFVHVSGLTGLSSGRKSVVV